MPSTSYASGTSTKPLLGETIDANLRGAVARFGDREALVDVAAGRRADLRRAGRRGRRASPAACWRRGVAQGRPGRHLGAELRRVGPRRSTPRRGSARSWSTSTRPTAPTSCEYVLQPGRHPHAGLGAGVQDQRLRGDDRRGARRAARRCGDVVFIGDADVGRAARRRRPPSAAERSPRGRRRCTSTTRSTSSTPRARPASPRARRCSHHNILNNGYFVGEVLRLHRGRTGSACRCPSTTASAW